MGNRIGPLSPYVEKPVPASSHNSTIVQDQHPPSELQAADWIWMVLDSATGKVIWGHNQTSPATNLLTPSITNTLDRLTYTHSLNIVSACRLHPVSQSQKHRLFFFMVTAQ